MSLLLLVLSASGQNYSLQRVAPGAGGTSTRNLADLGAGTMQFQITPSGQWEPVSEPASPTGLGGLLNPNPTAKVQVSGSGQDFLFQFNSLERLDRVAFQQLGQGGKVALYAADAPYPPDSPRWQQVAAADNDTTQALVNLNFPSTSTKFLLLSMVYPDGGEVGSLFLASDLAVANGSSAIPPPEEWPATGEEADFDFARPASGGRVAYIGSGKAEEAHRIVDGDPTTFFDFEASDQEGAFFIVALAENYPVYQASISARSAIRSVELWTFDSYPSELIPPDGTEASGPLTVPDAFIKQRPTTGRVDVPEDEDVTALNIPLPNSTANYMLVRVTGKYPGEPIQVNLFSVLGRVPREYLGYRRPLSNRIEFAPPNVDPEQEPEQPDPPRIPPASP